MLMIKIINKVCFLMFALMMSPSIWSEGEDWKKPKLPVVEPSDLSREEKYEDLKEERFFEIYAKYFSPAKLTPDGGAPYIIIDKVNTDSILKTYEFLIHSPNGDIIGSISLEDKVDTIPPEHKPSIVAHLGLIKIYTQYQGIGLGGYAMNYITQLFDLLNCPAMTLDLRSANPAARRVYARAGFRVDNEFAKQTVMRIYKNEAAAEEKATSLGSTVEQLGEAEALLNSDGKSYISQMVRLRNAKGINIPQGLDRIPKENALKELLERIKKADGE